MVQTNATSNLQTGNKQIIVGGQRILLNSNQSIVTQGVPATMSQSQAEPEKVIVQQSPHLQKTAIVVDNSSQSPSSNTSRPTIIVQNQTLAQQISSGKVQIANVNGQQVLIRQTGNNQAVIVAHIKPQSEGPAQVVPVQGVSQQQPAAAVAAQPAPIQQPIVQKTVSVQSTSSTVSSTNNDLSPAMEQALLKGQPPGTVIKCVTAQVIQTQQGPRIVLQGLHGADFTQQQSALVQQQVKQQLLKGKF